MVDCSFATYYTLPYLHIACPLSVSSLHTMSFPEYSGIRSKERSQPASGSQEVLRLLYTMISVADVGCKAPTEAIYAAHLEYYGKVM